MSSTALFLLALGVGTQSHGASPDVAHPEIPCWLGQRGWTQPGEPVSDMIAYGTQDDIQPFLITHNRDHIRQNAEVVQDYNFIDYWFGDPAHPIRARYYLRDDESVLVDLPGDAGERFSLEEIRSRFPSDVLCYLQRRFDRITVMVDGGYEELWPHAQ